MMKNKSLAILNLTGELLPELASYFSSRGVLVIDPLKSSEQHDWTHIITKDVHHFDLINDTYKLTENNCHVISLSKVEDLQNFTINNGNMVLDDCWFKGMMGAFIMDKYFQGYGGISLGDNYPTFKEDGSFNIANPFNTGEYLDRMVQKAFESGIEALTLKTYFDHLVMYLAGLKKKGKAGLPFEVTYGSFEEIFAIQIHFFSQQLQIMDVATSLSSTLSRKAEEYFLNVAVQSADFFDFSYMPEVNKVVVTALWTKDERIKFENRGLMFTSLEGSVSLVRMESSDETPLTLGETVLDDHTDKVLIPSTVPEDVSKTVLKASQDVSLSSVTVSGANEEQKGSTVVKGTTQTPDEGMLIKGDGQLEELVQTVRGKFEEDKSVVRISGEKLDVDKFAVKIAASVDESTKEKDMKVRSLGTKLPDSIKTGLFDFAKNLNKDVEDLNDDELDNFQVQKMPEIIQQGLINQIRVQATKEKAQSQEMKVQSLGNMPVMNSSVSMETIKALEARLLTSNSDNEKLKTQLKALSSEVRILKESRNKLAEIHMKASQAANEINIKESDEEDEALRRHFQQKLNDQKTLNEQDLKKLSTLLERESKLIADVKHEEMKARKLQIEAQQKETYFMQELEKSERQTKAKDLILIKTKETFTKLIEKKEREVSEIKAKADQLAKALTAGPSTTQTQAFKDLEKQNQNLNKQLEVYKIKISSLATNMGPSKTEESLKEDGRKLQMINQQMKNQLDLSKREVEKLQTKSSMDNSQLLLLKQEKAKLEQLLKKAAIESAKEAAAPQNNLSDQELKRLQAQNQILETQVKDSSQKIANLETKLAEALKPQKSAVSGDENSKVKVTQLENSVKKLTQDLVESRNQLGEMKKETNKLRQDKTALQNQLDKLKKEADKAKPASPKKPGGKAA